MEQPPPPPPLKRQLTLKITGIGSSSISAAMSSTPPTQTPSASFSSAMSPPPATPSQGPAKKIKINVRKSLPPTPLEGAPSFKQPAVPASKTPALSITTKDVGSKIKLASAIKRTNGDGGNNVALANGTGSGAAAKKVKLNNKITLKTPISATARTPTVKVKTAGKIPHRPLGEGYDSEAEDREVDPVIEEQLLFRMMPGEHCEYLRTAIQERKIGLPKAQGGADVSFKFLDEEGRRIMFVIQGQPYAGIILDLPTITEGTKTWDKKALVKSADICQMLLVFAKVRNEEEAKTAPLPKAVEHGHRWPHGITPPMHDARNRRFRKRLSKLEIQNKEAEVERLLAADKDAVSTKYEFVDERQTVAPVQEESEDDEEEDAEGEVDDYFGDAEMTQDNEDLFEVDEAELEAAFMVAAETPADAMNLDTPTVGNDAITPATANTGTPAAQTEESDGEADGDEDESGDEDDDEEDEEGDDGDDGGDEERHDEVAGVRVELANLRKQLAEYEKQLAASQMPVMKKRIEGSIKNIKAEIRLKQSSIGEADEDD